MRDSWMARGVLLVALLLSLFYVLWIAPPVQAQIKIKHLSDEPYPNMPAFAPIGVRIAKYADVPEFAKGPAIDPAKGYRLQMLGKDLFMITDNVYQSIFLVYEDGVVVADAPPSYADKILNAIKEVTDKPITHLIYSHAHVDHIGGTPLLGPVTNIIAQDETKKLLEEANDPNRPLPTITFTDNYTLTAGSHTLELSYHGNGHEPGNIFIYAPEQKTLMVVDIVFPGWMPFRRWAIAQNIPGFFRQVDEINKMEWDTFVGGHVARTGTHDDVEQQWQFMNDVKQAAADALKNTAIGENMDPADLKNPWAVFDNYIDRVVIECVNTVSPKWQDKFAAYDVFIWDQCYTMEQSLRVD